MYANNKVAKPSVFIPVFPGTNCEYDSAKAFERAGADTIVKVFKNLTAEDIRDSVDEFVKAIDKSQIIMFPGGFSAGDEPDGSGKFIANALRNERIANSVMELLKNRDGLALGICNGFQALIKLGLVPYGEIRMQTPDSPTLTMNTIGRHVSKMVYTKVVTNKSPLACRSHSLAEYTVTLLHTVKVVSLPTMSGLRSSLRTDRLLHSTVTLMVMYLWMKSGILTVHTWLLKVSQAQTEDAR